MGIFSDKSGMDCVKDETDGTITCTKFEAKRGGKFATGSTARLAIDQQCNVQWVGHRSVLKGDEDDFDEMAKKIQAACRNGVQSQ